MKISCIPSSGHFESNKLAAFRYLEQENISVGCAPPTCHYTSFGDHQMSVQVEGDPQVNKFEKISSDGHQMSLARAKGGPVQLGPMSGGTLYSQVPCLKGAVQ